MTSDGSVRAKVLSTVKRNQWSSSGGWRVDAVHSFHTPLGLEKFIHALHRKCGPLGGDRRQKSLLQQIGGLRSRCQWSDSCNCILLNLWIVHDRRICCLAVLKEFWVRGLPMSGPCSHRIGEGSKRGTESTKGSGGCWTWFQLESWYICALNQPSRKPEFGRFSAQFHLQLALSSRPTGLKRPRKAKEIGAKAGLEMVERSPRWT